MSRSYKKSKFYNIFAGHDSDKDDKVRAHKKFRRKTKEKIALNKELPNSLREVSEIWDFSSEGVFIYAPEENPKYFRK